MPRIHLHIPDDDAHLLEELRERARREDRSQSEQIRRYLRAGLERDDDRERERRRRRR